MSVATSPNLTAKGTAPHSNELYWLASRIADKRIRGSGKSSQN